MPVQIKQAICTGTHAQNLSSGLTDGTYIEEKDEAEMYKYKRSTQAGRGAYLARGLLHSIPLLT